ncbi:MAG: glycosyl hydrolase, partial [Saprospiraceae bacterium]|nr:glycosyl hydrolase [Saprospiraceae bacterium]
FKTMVIIDPGIKIDREYSVFNEAFEKGYFCRRADGPYVKGKVWPGDCYFPDFTNPEVREWWAGLFSGLIEEVGIAGVWNDMNEPALFEVPNKTFPDDVRMDYDGNPCSHRKGHNIYGMQMTRATYEGVKRSLKGKRPLIITRSGYNGLQRFTSVWTGDNLASWEHLVIAHYQTQRLNISGISFCGSDIGGFIGQPSGELYVRWIQMAIFHPFMRTHSSGDHGDQEPWSFGEKYMDYVRKFINIRYKILPYIYTCFYQYHKNGTPMIRPTEFVHDEDATRLINRKVECYLGDHLLYAPIMQPGSQGRIVHLPSGKWYDYYTHAQYEGDSEYYIEADLNKIPFFIKAGAIFPEFPLMQYTGERAIETLTLKIFLEEGQHKSYLYSDDHDGYSYKDGQYRYAELVMHFSNGILTIEQLYDTAYSTQYQNFKLELIGMDSLKKELDVRIDDQAPIVMNIDALIIPENFRKLDIML